eukprot:gene13791-19700_t
MNSTWEDALQISNLVATVIFVVEVGLKWMAYGIFSYFKSKWNVFDFVVTLASVAAVMAEYLSTPNIAILSLLRAARVLRIFRVVPKAPGLRVLVQSIMW